MSIAIMAQCCIAERESVKGDRRVGIARLSVSASEINNISLSQPHHGPATQAHWPLHQTINVYEQCSLPQAKLAKLRCRRAQQMRLLTSQVAACMLEPLQHMCVQGVTSLHLHSC